MEFIWQDWLVQRGGHEGGMHDGVTVQVLSGKQRIFPRSDRLDGLKLRASRISNLARTSKSIPVRGNHEWKNKPLYAVPIHLHHQRCYKQIDDTVTIHTSVGTKQITMFKNNNNNNKFSDTSSSSKNAGDDDSNDNGTSHGSNVFRNIKERSLSYIHHFLF